MNRRPPAARRSALHRALAVAACSVALMAVACAREPDRSAAAAPSFEAACREPALRPAYLHAVRERVQLPDYVSGIDYLDDRAAQDLLGDPVLRPHPGLATVPIDPADRTPAYAGGRRSRLVVLPAAFDCALAANTGEIVLMLGLLDHELVHARQARFGLSSVSIAAFRALPPATATVLYDVVAELEAYRNELGQAASYRLPTTYYRVAMGAYLEHYLRLFDERLAIDATIRDRLLIDLFERWMLDQGEIFARDDEGWRFQVDGATYRFPTAVVSALQERVGNQRAD